MRIGFILPAALAVSVLVGCGERHRQTLTNGDGAPAAELAPFMSRLQVYSQKLGYSIEAHNPQLALFYLHEMHETVEEIQAQVPRHDGHEIGKLAATTVEPLILTLQGLLRAEDETWERRAKTYDDLIAGCNACHLATAHGFIHILPAEVESPFNQRFAPVATPPNPAPK